MPRVRLTLPPVEAIRFRCGRAVSVGIGDYSFVIRPRGARRRLTAGSIPVWSTNLFWVYADHSGHEPLSLRANRRRKRCGFENSGDAATSVYFETQLQQQTRLPVLVISLPEPHIVLERPYRFWNLILLVVRFGESAVRLCVLRTVSNPFAGCFCRGGPVACEGKAACGGSRAAEHRTAVCWKCGESQVAPARLIQLAAVLRGRTLREPAPAQNGSLCWRQ